MGHSFDNRRARTERLLQKIASSRAPTSMNIRMGDNHPIADFIDGWIDKMQSTEMPSPGRSPDGDKWFGRTAHNQRKTDELKTKLAALDSSIPRG